MGIYQNNEQLFQSQYGLDYPLTRLKPRRAYANTYPLKGDYFHFHTLDPDRDMPKIMHIIHRDDLIDDPNFKGHWKDEGAKAEEIRKIMDEGFSKMTVEEAKAAFAEQDIAFGELCGPQQVLKDPQAEANQMLFHHTLLNGREAIYAASPLKFMDDTPCEDGPAPRLGQNTVELLKSCGYDDDKIKELADKNIITVDQTV